VTEVDTTPISIPLDVIDHPRPTLRRGSGAVCQSALPTSRISRALCRMQPWTCHSCDGTNYAGQCSTLHLLTNDYL